MRIRAIVPTEFDVQEQTDHIGTSEAGRSQTSRERITHREREGRRRIRHLFSLPACEWAATMTGGGVGEGIGSGGPGRYETGGRSLKRES